MNKRLFLENIKAFSIEFDLLYVGIDSSVHRWIVLLSTLLPEQVPA